MPDAPLRVLIVDDHPMVRAGLRSMLSGDEVDVVGEAASAAEAVERAVSLRPALVLLDVKLPDIHGFELCRRLKRMDAFKNTPIMFVSASGLYNDPRDRVEGLLSGAAVFLPKPISVDKLWDEIEALLS